MKRYVTGLGAALCLAAGLAGCSGDDPAPQAGGGNQFPPLPIGFTYFDVTDEAGHWFDTGTTIPNTSTRSLAIVPPGSKIKFLQTRSIKGASRVESFHTVTSLIYPGNAKPSEIIDQPTANKDDHEVTLDTPGLHVFVCKVHPYMLAGVIVDDPATTDPNSNPPGGPAFDIGDTLHLVGVTAGVQNPAPALPSNSNIGLRLLRAFFVVTSPTNWKDYTKVGEKYQPTYPKVAVRVSGGLVVPDLDAALQTFDGDTIPALQTPTIDGVGEVWVDTQYEISAGKGARYPSTMTVVNAEGADKWKVKRKIALPAQKMNNAHNMWASHDQKQIYNTEWHGRSLYVLNREDGKLLQSIVLGQDPAHVMTRVDTEQVHVTLNGEDSVSELDKAANGNLTLKRRIPMQAPGDPQTQPHAHWMGHDGKTMATPNSNSNDSTFFDFVTDAIKAKPLTGPLPIAAAMNPTSTKYYVSNYLGHSTSVIDMATGNKIKDIQLLLNGNYNPVTGAITGPIGGLPIQTPVSPDGKFVITGNTLTGTITIIRTSDDTLVAMVPCDPGCHGVNFGAKKGGGYYAYITSKFSNRLIVLDYDADNDGIVTQSGQDAPVIAGWVVLVDDATTPKDDDLTGNKGMGGQGVLPVPNVYNGWVQLLPDTFKTQLTPAQQNPVATP